MTKNRPSQPCRTCGRRTKSTTRFCHSCRPADAIPYVHRVPTGVSFAGQTFTHDQAIALANTIIDALEREPS